MFCRIISTVLNWDNRDLENRALKIEGDKATPLSKDQLQCLKDYANKSREEQDQMRHQSRKQVLSYPAACVNDL
jgi:hypothetical protein